MSELRDINLPPPSNSNDFEKLCLALWRRLLNDPNAQLNGRRGQAQDGVDIFGRRANTQRWVGIQCKARSGGQLSIEEINADIKKAKCFNPRLSELVFATTAPRDVHIQKHARNQCERIGTNDEFQVAVQSWDDIRHELIQDYNVDLIQRFYSDYFFDLQQKGIALSKLLVVRVGIAGKPDSSHEIMLGKTPRNEDPEDYMGLNYWRGIYFILNWNNMTIRKFKLPVIPGDLRDLFYSSRDTFIVEKWLSSIESIDDVIYGEENVHEWTINIDEFKEYCDRQREAYCDLDE